MNWSKQTDCGREVSCRDDPAAKHRIVQEIRQLMRRLEDTPCLPRPEVAPSLHFIEKKQPRYYTDPKDIPTITQIPVLELRPTSEYKKIMKNKDGVVNNVVYVNIPPPPSNHVAPPWGLPSSNSYQKEKLPCPKKKCVCCPGSDFTY